MINFESDSLINGLNNWIFANGNAVQVVPKNAIEIDLNLMKDGKYVDI